MASLKNLLSACALLALAGAAPVADVTLTNTVTKTHYATKNCVKTVWLPAGQSPGPTSASSSQGPSTTLIKSVVYKSTTTITTTTQYVPPPVPTSTYVAPTTTSPVPAPVPTTPAYTPPAVVTTEAPAYTLPPVATTEAPAPTTEAPAPVADPAPSSEAPAPSAVSAGSGGTVQASASNSCKSASDACEGDVTHYDGGLGACGWNVDTASEMAVALPVGFMGSQSNGNPYCGRTITVKNPTSGTMVQAKVGDKCMGCEGRAIDLTDALFKAVTDGTGDGRESGYQWWFN